MKTELRRFSPLTFWMERFFYYAQWTSPANILFKTRAQSQLRFKDEQAKHEETIRRGRMIDCYILVWFLIELLSLATVWHAPSSGQMVLGTLAGLRIIEIAQTAVNMNLFDSLRLPARTHFVSSATRTAIFSLWNFFEVALCYGVLYSNRLVLLSRKDDALDPFYFSFVSQLTIGYGDILAYGWTRLLVMTQGALGFLLAVVAVSRVIAFLPRTEPVLGDK